MFRTIEQAGCPVAAYAGHVGLALVVSIAVSAHKVPHKVAPIHLVHLPAEHKFQVIGKCRRLVVGYLQPLAVKLDVLRISAECTRQNGGMVINIIFLLATYLVPILALSI